MAHPNLSLRRLPIHLSSIYIIEISINTLTSFYTMVYPLVSRSDYYWSYEWGMGMGLDQGVHVG